MPIINGRMEHWWNWSAKDPTSGVTKTFFTNGRGNIVTREQLFEFVKRFFPCVDLRDFSCELTDRMPQTRRDPVAPKFYMKPSELEFLRMLQGDSTPPQVLKPERKFYGFSQTVTSKRAGGSANGVQRRFSVV